MKAGIYARVSTHDQHTLGMQIDAVKKYVQARGWTIEMKAKFLKLVLALKIDPNGMI